MALRIIGTSQAFTADVDDVDESGDGELAVNVPVSLTGSPAHPASLLPGRGPGFAAIASERDPGNITPNRAVYQTKTDRDYRLRSGVDSLLFFEPWSQTTINSGTWSLVTAGGMLAAVNGGYCKLNSGLLLTASASAIVTTLRTVPLYTSFATRAVFQLQIQAAAPSIANTVWEAGFFFASGTTAPTDGIFVRMSAAGVLSLVASYAGAETVAVAPTSALSPFVRHQFEISVLPSVAELWIDNVLYASIPRPTTNPSLTESPSLPFSTRLYNTASPPASFTTLALGPVEISSGAMKNNARFSDRISMSEQGGYQTQSGVAAPAQTALWANNTVPGTAALSNTAASYTTFGGEFLFAAVAGAETDYCLFGFQVPLETVGGMNRALLIRGVRIQTTALGAAVGATGCVLQWGIAVGSAAVTLAQAEVTSTASAVKGPRRKALGMQAFVAAAPVGTTAMDIKAKFKDSPLFAESGSFVQIILRVPVGTLGGGSTFRGTVDIDAQYE